MPPFRFQYSSSTNGITLPSTEQRSAPPSDMAPGIFHPHLEPRASADSLSAALAPLEPLSSFDTPTHNAYPINDISKRDLSFGLDSSSHQLGRRALQTNVIPLSYNFSGAKPGVVVGATLGAVLGFILLFYLITLLTQAQGTGAIEGSDVTDVRVHRSRTSDARSRRTRRTRTHRSEMSERTSPPRPRRERILVEERRRQERSRAPDPEPEPLSPETEREHVEVEERETERRVEGDDVVEVIEEQSDITPEPPRRKKSGYRTVDPNEYGGGSFPTHELSDTDRRRRRHH